MAQSQVKETLRTNTVKWKLLLTHHHWAEWYCFPQPWNKEPGAEPQQTNIPTTFANGGGETPMSRGVPESRRDPIWSP